VLSTEMRTVLGVQPEKFPVDDLQVSRTNT